MAMKTPAKRTINRRKFFRDAATAAAGTATAGAVFAGLDPSVDVSAQEGGAPGAGSAAAPPPTPEQVARDSGNVRPVGNQRAAVRPGSDLMVQVLRDLGVEYVAANPGSSFEGLQESLINYGEPPNVKPEFITALHEESAVTMAHGYGKATGKPMCALL